MTLSQLEAFVMVAEMRSFTAAAMRLSISQSAISHAIKALEREWGVRLFLREQGDVETMEIGRQLLGKAREILGLAESIRQEAADSRGLKQGSLRIGSFGPTSSLRLLPKLLERFSLEYPGIEVHVDEGSDDEVLQWIRDRRVDLGFVVLPEEGFETVELVEDQLVAILPSSHPLAGQPSVRLEALCSDPFILTEAGSTQLVTKLFEAAHLTPRIRYRNSQILSTLSLAACGAGISIIAELAIPPQSDRFDAMYVVKPLNPPAKRRVGIGYHGRQSSPAVQAFVKLIGKARSSDRYFDFPDLPLTS